MIKHNAGDLIARIQDRIAKLNPSSQVMRAAFTRAGVLISSKTKLNIRSQGLIDTGRLINSIRFEVQQSDEKITLRVGSYGVPYAAVHEFGYRGNVNVRGHRRMMVQAFGKPIDPVREIEIKPHSRFVNIRARPYLRPAVNELAPTIVDIIREAMRGNG